MGPHVNSLDPARRVMDAIRQIVQALRLFDRAAEKKAGVGGAQLFVLQKLSEIEPVSVNDLALRTHTHQSSVSVVVQRLVDRKLIARAKSPRDARQLDLSITRKGRAVLRAAPRAAQDRLIDSLQSLPKKSCAELAKTLEGIVANAGGATEIPMLFFEDHPKSPKQKKRPNRVR